MIQCRAIEKLRTINLRPRCGAGMTAIAGNRQAKPPVILAMPTLRVRKRIEDVFGWIKTVGGLHSTKLRGLPKVDWDPHLCRRLRPGEGGATRAPAELGLRLRRALADRRDRPREISIFSCGCPAGRGGDIRT